VVVVSWVGVVCGWVLVVGGLFVWVFWGCFCGFGGLVGVGCCFVCFWCGCVLLFCLFVWFCGCVVIGVLVVVLFFVWFEFKDCSKSYFCKLLEILVIDK
jgi:hypothetical protein